MKLLRLLSLALFLALACPAAAMAHAVFIFGWEEGGRLCTESYFSKTNRVRQGKVRVLSEDKTVLAQGVTDDAGLWCTDAPPEGGEVLLEVLAGEGHRAEFAMNLSARPAHNNGASGTGGGAPQGTGGSDPVSPSSPAGSPSSYVSPAGSPSSPSAPKVSAPEVSVCPPARPATAVISLPAQPPAARPSLPAQAGGIAANISREDLSLLVRDAVRAEIDPLRRDLAEKSQEAYAPGFVNIAGGIGWIVGLCGLGALFLRRRRG